MSTAARVTLFSIGGTVLVAGIGSGAWIGLVVLSSHDVKAERDFELPGVTLRIESDGGAVHLKRGDVPGRVHVNRTVTQSIDGADPTWSLNDGTLSLQTKCPNFFGVMCDGSYTVTVPHNVTAVTVRNDNGAVTADRLSVNSLDLRSDNGSVKVRDSVATTAKLESDNGSIGVDRSWLTNVDTKSDNGSVKVTLYDQPASVKAESDNGSVRVLVPQGTKYAVSAKTSNGKETVNSGLLGGTNLIDVQSDNGSVRVDFAPVPVQPRPNP